MCWLQAAAGDQPFYGFQQFNPICQRRIKDPLPLVKALFALGEQPFAAHALGVDLQLGAVLGNPFPTDFGFWHGLWLKSVLPRSQLRVPPAALASFRQIYTGNGHRGDAFFPTNEAHPFVRRGLHPNLFLAHA